MKSKLWVFRDINLSQRASLAHALSISQATASLFMARGVTTPDEAATWMSLQAPHKVEANGSAPAALAPKIWLAKMTPVGPEMG